MSRKIAKARIQEALDNKLESLDLSHLGLKSLPLKTRQLTQLTQRDLTYNKLSSLPSEIGQLKQLKKLYLTGNHNLNIPKEIIEDGAQAVGNYITSIQEAEEVDYLYEAKLVIVGRGNVRKTSLVRSLTRDNYVLEEKIESAEGIDIEYWDIDISLKKSDTFRLNFWDFGGQEKYDE